MSFRCLILIFWMMRGIFLVWKEEKKPHSFLFLGRRAACLPLYLLYLRFVIQMQPQLGLPGPCCDREEAQKGEWRTHGTVTCAVNLWEVECIFPFPQDTDGKQLLWEPLESTRVGQHKRQSVQKYLASGAEPWEGENLIAWKCASSQLLDPGSEETWLHTPFTPWWMAQPGQGRFHLIQRGSAQPLPTEQVAVALPWVASDVGEHRQILSVHKGIEGPVSQDRKIHLGIWYTRNRGTEVKHYMAEASKMPVHFSDCVGDQALTEALPESHHHVWDWSSGCIRMLPSGVIASQVSKQQLQITTNYSAHFKYMSVIK